MRMTRSSPAIRIFFIALAIGTANIYSATSLYGRWHKISAALFKNSIAMEHHQTSRQKDLSEYKFGGDFKGCNGLLSVQMPKCNELLIPARNFIWENWQAKKRAYITYSLSGIDAGINYKIFIEPDKKGTWRIIWIGKQWGLSSNQKTTQIVIYNLEHREFPATDSKSKEFYLLFTDKNGKEIEKL